MVEVDLLTVSGLGDEGSLLALRDVLNAASGGSESLAGLGAGEDELGGSVGLSLLALDDLEAVVLLEVLLEGSSIDNNDGVLDEGLGTVS